MLVVTIVLQPPKGWQARIRCQSGSSAKSAVRLVISLKFEPLFASVSKDSDRLDWPTLLWTLGPLRNVSKSSERVAMLNSSNVSFTRSWICESRGTARNHTPGPTLNCVQLVIDLTLHSSVCRLIIHATYSSWEQSHSGWGAPSGVDSILFSSDVHI